MIIPGIYTEYHIYNNFCQVYKQYNQVYLYNICVTIANIRAKFILCTKKLSDFVDHSAVAYDTHTRYIYSTSRYIFTAYV